MSSSDVPAGRSLRPMLAGLGMILCALLGELGPTEAAIRAQHRSGEQKASPQEQSDTAPGETLQARTFARLLDDLRNEQEKSAALILGTRPGATEPAHGDRRKASAVSTVERVVRRHKQNQLVLLYGIHGTAVELALIQGGTSGTGGGTRRGTSSSGSRRRLASIVTLAITPEALVEAVEEVNRVVRSRSRNNRGRLTRLLDELGDQLLGPAAEQLRGADSLVLLAPGLLLELPFAALRVPRSIDRARPYLAATHSVCFERAFEATALSSSGSTTSPPAFTRWSAAAFADPEFREDSRPLGAALADRGVSWRPRGASKREAELVVTLFERSSLFVGSAATRHALDSLALDTDLIHLAVAAEADPDPESSFLFLATEDPLQPADRVSASEIAHNLKTSAELVVLSAHQSSRWKQPAVAGASPLATAFHLAGARRVLLSLWPVANRSSTVLFDRYYRAVLDGQSAQRALQLAQIELLRGPIDVGRAEPLDASHPFYWAGFQLYGQCGSGQAEP